MGIVDAKIDKDSIIPAGLLLLGAGYIGYEVVGAPILEALGIKDTKSEAESKRLQEKYENAASKDNIWSPSFFQNPPAGSESLIFTYNDVTILTKKLYNAAGTFNDDEDSIYSVFRSCRYKTQVSYLAYWFNRSYGKDLYNWLKGSVLNDDEMLVVFKIVDKLPFGFKNTVTGKISGIGDVADYFKNIVDLIESGSVKMARHKYHSMSQEQKSRFIEWVSTFYHYEAEDYGENPIEEINKALGII